MRFFAILLSLDHNFFFEIAYDDSLRQCLTSNRGKAPPTPQKFLGRLSLGQNWTQTQVFHHFLKFGSLVFLKITQDKSLEQCLTTGRGKNHLKSLGTQNWPEIRFFTIFSSLHHQFSLILHRIAAWDNVYHLVELKPPKKKKMCGPNQDLTGPNYVFQHFLSYFIIKRGKILLEIFCILMWSGIQSNLLVSFETVQRVWRKDQYGITYLRLTQAQGTGKIPQKIFSWLLGYGKFQPPSDRKQVGLCANYVTVLLTVAFFSSKNNKCWLNQVGNFKAMVSKLHKIFDFYMQFQIKSFQIYKKINCILLESDHQSAQNLWNQI